MLNIVQNKISRWVIACTLFIFLFLACFTGIADQNPATDRDCVILLHGLARTHQSLSTMQKHLSENGFNVVNQPYPSREKTIEVLARETIPAALEKCAALSKQKVHFVTHSMGGILVRYYLDHHKIPNLGRVVMLSPPNNGSEVVDTLKDLQLFQWLNGPAGNQLGTDEHSILHELGDPYYETGIITGDQSINPFLSLMIPGKDDGKVSIESAKLKGMKDFLIVHESHPLIMNDKNVCRQVTSFIRTGKFERDSTSEQPSQSFQQ